jgi:hypothetical protein
VSQLDNLDEEIQIARALRDSLFAERESIEALPPAQQATLFAGLIDRIDNPGGTYAAGVTLSSLAPWAIVAASYTEIGPVGSGPNPLFRMALPFAPLGWIIRRRQQRARERGSS